MAELGLAFTKPSRRGLGCMSKLWAALLDEAKRMNLFGAFILAVTSHPYTQKCSHSFGFSDCAFLAADVPGLKFNKISESHDRESILVECRLFRHNNELPLYAPPNHEKMIRAICTRLGAEPLFKTAAHPPSLSAPGRLKVLTKPAFGTALMHVEEYGTQTFKKIQATSLSLLMNGLAPLFLYMPLDSPHAPELAARLEAEPGWFFAGVIPKEHTGFELIMQHSGKHKLDFSSLAPASEEVQSLLSYVQTCNARSRRKSGTAPV